MYRPPIDASFPRGRLRGTVTDGSTGLPLAGAVIWAQFCVGEPVANRGQTCLGHSGPKGACA